MKEFDPVECERRYGEFQINLTKISADVDHIKSRIDNGMSKSINEILVKVDGLVPMVNDNSKWITQIKWAVVWITVIAIGGGLASLTFAIVRKIVGI